MAIQRAHHRLESKDLVDRDVDDPAPGSAAKRLPVRALAAAAGFALAAALGGCGGADGEGTGSTVHGVAEGPMAPQFAQGWVTVTDNPMDLAIRGVGFFQVDYGVGAPMYTRNGQLHLDRDGYIVNAMQMRLLGRQANAAGVIESAGPVVPLKLNSLRLAPQATDRIDISMNLDSRVAATGRSASPGVNVADSATYNFATSLTAYDLRGQEINLTLFFQKSDAPGRTPGSITWNVYATANDLPVGGAPAMPVATLVFPADGSAPIAPSGKVTLAEVISGAYPSGAAVLPLTNVVLNLAGSTQVGSNFVIMDLTQTGSAPGQLTEANFQPNGVLMGRYSNGRSLPFGQIELATFGNLRCLQAAVDKVWRSTPACGAPSVGAPGSGGFGVLQVSALEAT